MNKITSRVFERLVSKKHLGCEIMLSHNNIYVLPSKMGVGFMGVAALNFVLGINYQNNLLLAIAYLMVMLLIVSLLYGFANMSGTKIQCVSIHSDYASAPPTINLEITTKKPLLDFQIKHRNSHLGLTLGQVLKSTIQALPVALPRGKHKIGRLKFLSHYPFGLVSVWSYLYIEESIYAYPNPLPTDETCHFVMDNKGELAGAKDSSLNDEFQQLLPYQQGMSMRRVSWRHYAKTQQLVLQSYKGEDEKCTLGYDFEQLQGDIEERLSKLSYLISNAEKMQITYALKLGHLQFKANNGEQHKVRCMEALSEFQ